MHVVFAGTVVALRAATGAMLGVLGRSSLRRTLPHNTGTGAVVMFRRAIAAVMFYSAAVTRAAFGAGLDRGAGMRQRASKRRRSERAEHIGFAIVGVVGGGGRGRTGPRFADPGFVARCVYCVHDLLVR